MALYRSVAQNHAHANARSSTHMPNTAPPTPRQSSLPRLAEFSPSAGSYHSVTL